MSSLHAYNATSTQFNPLASASSDTWDMSFRGSERSFVPSPQSFAPTTSTIFSPMHKTHNMQPHKKVGGFHTPSPYMSDMWTMEKMTPPSKPIKGSQSFSPSSEDFVEINSSSRGVWSASLGMMSIPKKVEERSPAVAGSPSTHNNTTNSSSIEDEITGQNLYKTELCRSFEENGTCRYGSKCQFAHGKHEIRQILRHPKYKTEVCKTFQNEGVCPYGLRCRFIHNVSESVTVNGQDHQTAHNASSPPLIQGKLPLKQSMKAIPTIPTKMDSNVRYTNPVTAGGLSQVATTNVNMYNKSAAAAYGLPQAPRAAAAGGLGFSPMMASTTEEWSTSWSAPKTAPTSSLFTNASTLGFTVAPVDPAHVSSTMASAKPFGSAPAAAKREAEKRLAIFQHLTEDN